MQGSITQINDSISMIDNGLLNTDGFGATYVVRGDSIALIETGTSLNAETILHGLDQLKIERDAIEHILLTHVHMDHAGGAGVLAHSLPNATVYIHSMTAPHLVEPSRLMKSVERAVGAMWSVYGTVVPLDPDRLKPAEQLQLDLGKGVVLEGVPTPGHSPDHVAFWDASNAAMYAGDSLGIAMRTHDLAFAVTPPPAFDLAAQLQCFETLAAYPIQTLMPSHFGVTLETPQNTITMMRERVLDLCREVRDHLHDESMPIEAMIDRLSPAKQPLEPALDLVVRGTIGMSIHGMKLHFERNPAALELF